MFAVATGCRGNSAPNPQQDGGTATRTGLEGTIRRGPIQPVCQQDVACDAPFSGRFEVHLGGRIVARFQSDSAGHFQVRLAPGTYSIVPDASAPPGSPGSQGHDVTVGPTGVTHVEIDFDTGIR